jgi:hypothetical protein
VVREGLKGLEGPGGSLSVQEGQTRSRSRVLNGPGGLLRVLRLWEDLGLSGRVENPPGGSGRALECLGGSGRVFCRKDLGRSRKDLEGPELFPKFHGGSERTLRIFFPGGFGRVQEDPERSFVDGST